MQVDKEPWKQVRKRPLSDGTKNVTFNVKKGEYSSVHQKVKWGIR